MSSLRSRDKKKGQGLRGGIQILNDELCLLSAGYIERREVSQFGKAQSLGSHHGCSTLPTDCFICFLTNKRCRSLGSRVGLAWVPVTVCTDRGWIIWTGFTHGWRDAVEARGGALRGAGRPLDGEHAAGSPGWIHGAAAPGAALFPRSLAWVSFSREISLQFYPTGLPLLQGGRRLQER